VVKPSEIPNRGPKVDAIGRKLADLGLGLPTETPRSAKSGATTPGAMP